MHPGERIRKIRKNKGLNQTNFAKQLGYSQKFLSDIEVGKVGPSREFLKKLNEVFGISSDYILYGPEDHGKSSMIKEPDSQYELLPVSTKKIIENVIEILESGNEIMINALKSNIKAFLEAVRMAKKQNEDKEG